MEEKQEKGYRMAMPTLVQNVMNGREVKSVAVWKVTVRQLKVELERLDNFHIYDDQFIREVLDCCEAFARLHISAMKLLDYESVPDWLDVVDLHDNVGASALGFDEKFLRKQKLRLEEKGLG